MDYNSLPGMRASALIDFAEHPSKYYRNHILKVPNTDTEHSIRGTLVDLGMTNNTEELQKRFHIASAPIPVGQMLDLCNNLIPRLLAEEAFETAFEESFKSTGTKLSLNTFKSRYEEEGKAYVEERISNSDKTLISKELFDESKDICGVIENSPEFKGLLPSADQGIMLIHPVVAWEERSPYFENVPEDLRKFKCELDFMVVNDYFRTIQAVDLKVKDMRVEMFPYDFIKRKYYIQAAIQYMACVDHAKALLIQTGETYEVLMPAYLVYSLPTKEVILFQTTQKDISTAICGGITKGGKEIRGIVTLLNDIGWHLQSNLWNRERPFYTADGGVFLDVFQNDIPYFDYDNSTGI